ncbi:hypothetical protein QR680_015270 [Steinernema hermaphroditum]|uniref:ATP-dependent DNA ligase family profile domain-containing protein n=1 Tax=Steinernema hermaphroditum TaxID=289476 RepID=A0AA39H9A6_9BILA|nr:hypothetical protein QR680_015270 [Steinernema hermaphroditum]
MAAMESFKRPALPSSLVPVSGSKRVRLDEGAVMLAEDAQLPPRSPNLQAPIVSLSGHEGEIYTSRFSSDGSCLASAGFDQKILLWNVFGDCENFSHFRGHTGAVMDLHFNADDSHLFSCSTDKTVRVWDLETGVCNRKFKSNKDIVNACFPARRGPQLVVSASDDGCILVHDVRKRNPVMEFKAKYQTKKPSPLVEKCKLLPGVPLKPMLERPTKGIDKVMRRFGSSEFACESKYDGEGQIHRSDDGKVVICSRNQENITGKCLDIITELPKCFGNDVKNFITDGEVVAWDMEKKSILPFQTLSTGKRKAGGEPIAVNVCAFFFDLLCFNGSSLCRSSYRERRIGTGFKDEDLKEQYKMLAKHKIEKPRDYYVYDITLKPDHWFKRAVVWEVKAADLSISPRHFAAQGIVDKSRGISLRFPRYICLRQDKNATTAQQDADIYRNQEQIKNTSENKNPAGGDDCADDLY